MGLLIGAALATVWRPGRLPLSIAKPARIGLTIAGIGSIVLILGFYIFSSEFSPFLYRGGFLVLALVVAGSIALATHPALPLGAWLGVAPLRYLGQRSYGIYLWHWPIFMVTRPGQDIPLEGLPLFALRMALTLGIAELSYRFVEMPIRRGALARTWKRLKTGSSSAKERVLVTTAGVGTAIVALATAMALALVPSTAAVPPDVTAAIGNVNEVLIDQPSTLNSPAPEPTANNSTNTAAPEEETQNTAPLSVIGDSVVLGARNAIEDSIPGTTIDASVSRFPGGFIGRVKKLSKRDQLADIVAIHPGTNGVMPESMLRDLLDQLSDYQKVILINSSMPRSWEKPNNAVIDRVAPDYPNVVIADWKSLSQGRPEYFVSDKVHLTKKGAEAFASLIKESVPS